MTLDVATLQTAFIFLLFLITLVVRGVLGLTCVAKAVACSPLNRNHQFMADGIGSAESFQSAN